MSDAAVAAVAGAGAADGADIDLGAVRSKIRAAFDLFDKEGKGTIIEEEVPTVMRYLGVYPSEQDIVTTILPQIQVLTTAFMSTDRDMYDEAQDEACIVNSPALMEELGQVRLHSTSRRRACLYF